MVEWSCSASRGIGDESRDRDSVYNCAYCENLTWYTSVGVIETADVLVASVHTYLDDVEFMMCVTIVYSKGEIDYADVAHWVKDADGERCRSCVCGWAIVCVFDGCVSCTAGMNEDTMIPKCVEVESVYVNEGSE